VEINAVASILFFIEAILYFMTLSSLCLVMAVGFYIYWYQSDSVFFFFFMKHISMVK